MSGIDEMRDVHDVEELRRRNREFVVHSKMLMAKFDRTKNSAAEGGYADGLYPDLYTPDGRFEAPFMPAGLKNYRQGRDEHAADAEMRFNLLKDYRWVKPLDVRDCVDPNKFFVFASGEGTTMKGEKYTNDYVMYFELENGKIKLYQEYFNTSKMASLAVDIRENPRFAST